MADRIEDGGPAFPVSAPLYEVGMTGMSLRDWFAGQAMLGMVTDHTTRLFPEEVCKAAYKYADTMLAARTHTEEAA